jgi:hypothetical protein
MKNTTISAEQKAFNKVYDCVNSCTNQLQLAVSETLITLYKMRYPAQKVNVAQLRCLVQLKRTELLIIAL